MDIVLPKGKPGWYLTGEESEAFYKPALMGKLYNGLNSARGHGIFTERQHPWTHPNVREYLQCLGAGIYWPMPTIPAHSEAADSLIEEWKQEAISTWKILATNFCRAGDILLSRLEGLTDAELTKILSTVWDRTRQEPSLLQPLFDQCQLPTEPHEDWKLWASHTRGVQLVNPDPGNAEARPIPIPLYSFTPPQAQTGISPDFTNFNTFCAQNRLIFQIPCLNLNFLRDRGLLNGFIASRALREPAEFVTKDFDAMHIGRTGRLLQAPFRDGCFLAFEHCNDEKSPPMSLKGFYTGQMHFPRYARLIPSPSPMIPPDLLSIHRQGRVLGWSDGLLVLQAQAVIHRFCNEVFTTVVAGGLQTTRLPPIPPSWPVNVPWKPVSEAQYNQQAEMQESHKWPSSRRKKHLKDPKMWYDNTFDLLDKNLPYATIRSGWMIDKFQMTHDRGYDLSPGHELFIGAHEETKNHLTKMLGDARVFRRMIRDHMTLTHHYGWVREKAEAGQQDPDTCAQLPHLTNGDIDAKRALANDAIRRCLRMLFFALEIFWGLDQMWNKLQANGPFNSVTDLEDKGRRATYIDFICAMRHGAALLFSMLRQAGFLHAMPAFRNYCHRQPHPTEWEASWPLPRGFFEELHIAEEMPELTSTRDLRLENETVPGGNTIDGFLFSLNQGPPSENFGVPSMAEVSRALHADLEAIGYPEGASPLVSMLTRYIAQMLMLDRLLSHTVSFADFRMYLNFKANWSHKVVETLRERFVNFTEHFDEFAFEDHIDSTTVANVHLLLGIKYANDPRTELTNYEARQTIERFRNKLEEWMNRAKHRSHGYAAQSRSEKKQGMSRASVASSGNAPPSFAIGEYCGEINTIDPDFQLPTPVQQPALRPAAPPQPKAPKNMDNVKQQRKQLDGPIDNSNPDYSGPQKLRRRDWDLIADLWGENRSRSLVLWDDVSSLLCRMGMSHQNSEGGKKEIGWTPACSFPKPTRVSITIHVPHVEGRPHWLDGATKFRVADSIARNFGFTEKDIELYYSGFDDLKAQSAQVVFDRPRKRKRRDGKDVVSANGKHGAEGNEGEDEDRLGGERDPKGPKRVGLWRLW